MVENSLKWLKMVDKLTNISHQTWSATWLLIEVLKEQIFFKIAKTLWYQRMRLLQTPKNNSWFFFLRLFLLLDTKNNSSLLLAFFFLFIIILISERKRHWKTWVAFYFLNKVEYKWIQLLSGTFNVQVTLFVHELMDRYPHSSNSLFREIFE